MVDIMIVNMRSKFKNLERLVTAYLGLVAVFALKLEPNRNGSG